MPERESHEIIEEQDRSQSIDQKPSYYSREYNSRHAYLVKSILGEIERKRRFGPDFDELPRVEQVNIDADRVRSGLDRIQDDVTDLVKILREEGRSGANYEVILQTLREISSSITSIWEMYLTKVLEPLREAAGGDETWLEQIKKRQQRFLHEFEVPVSSEGRALSFEALEEIDYYRLVIDFSRIVVERLGQAIPEYLQLNKEQQENTPQELWRIASGLAASQIVLAQRSIGRLAEMIEGKRDTNGPLLSGRGDEIE